MSDYKIDDIVTWDNKNWIITDVVRSDVEGVRYIALIPRDAVLINVKEEAHQLKKNGRRETITATGVMRQHLLDAVDEIQRSLKEFWSDERPGGFHENSESPMVKRDWDAWQLIKKGLGL